ncbi:hypothetical protein EJB05_06508, partial [Eragrostis curvula]
MAIARELPEEILADILRRLPPRGLAASRRVCRAWRDAVDAHQLLRADLLPRAVRGIFMNYCAMYRPEFFSRPNTGPAIWGDLEFIPGFWGVKDHCNGLLLGEATGGHLYVANPATRRWARLPRRPISRMGEAFPAPACLVYDPIASPHYEVFFVPILPYDVENRLGPEMLQSEWPPSSYALQVFSSLAGRWEERLFAREGCAAGLIGDMQKCIRWGAGGHSAAYWRGALYFHQANASFISVFMSNAEYKLIPVPTDVEFTTYGSFQLGRSEKGLYCAFSHDGHGLWIFFLDESCSQAVWVLKHRVDLKTFARKLHAREGEYCDEELPEGPWILQNINDYKYPCGNDKEPIVEEKYEWNSDDDNVLDTDHMVEGNYQGYVGLLGFHPYKEVVFLDASLRRAIAYHWNTSKFQDLGNTFPKDYAEIAGHVASIDTSFPYTPCWMEDFPETKWDARTESDKD